VQQADAGRSPLAGLRVLDLGSEIAAGYATRLLADAGADVIKLEAPGGDPLRRWRAGSGAVPDGRDGALFRYLAGGKRSAVADLDTPAGRARLQELAREADLVFEDLGPPGLAPRGLGFEALRAGNERLSLVSLSPWGLEGPLASRPATEFTLQAASGSLAYRGLPERGPVGAGGRLGEWVTGPYVALGGLFAWLSARRTGRGQHVDVSMFEAVIASMTLFHDLQGQFFAGPLPQSIETPSIEPARDGWVGFATYTGQQWKDFCLLIERPELALDERFFDAKARMAHLPFIHEAIHAFTRRHTVNELLELATALRIPAAPIGDGRRVLEFDQFRERGVFVRSADGEFRQPRVPYRLEGVAPPPPRPAPRLGEHGASARFEGARLPVGRGGDPLPLAGIRIVDLTAFLAGPLATSLLADLGADVIKVESIQRPDGMRFAGALRNEMLWEWSPIFHGANPGKRGITLNLDDPRGRELLLRLVDGADALLENFSVRVLEHFGLDAKTLRARNPRLVLLRMPAWGLDGPWRDRVGFAPNVEQASGLAWLTGYPDLPLVVRGACDPLGGMHAAFALLLALEERARTGVGPQVEVPLCEPALCAAAEQVIEWTAYGELLARGGNRGPYAAPQGVYRCAPGQGERACEWLALAVASDLQWQGLRRALGDPPALRDPRLARAAGRREAHDAIDAQLAAWCAARPCAEAEAALLAAGVPASACTNAHFLLPNAQLEARGFFGALEHRIAGSLRHPEIPMHFRGLGRHLHRRGPPTLGQHNEELLRELGLGDAEIEALREQKVIGERPAFM
jgi:crotonobetainyl-CoA:carnitine CoA-transferase CaiB-like acyl-CoA transferase